jgi:serine/threonine-protein kinase
LQVCPEDATPLQADSTMAVAVPVDPLLGRLLDGKYRLDERLGEGGMGRVYRATHLLIERTVAVKVLNSNLVTDEEAKERFRREARAAGRLRHTNAVAVTDFGQTADGLVYIVMELLEGQSLREVLVREAPLDAARAVSLMLQVSAAVGAAHDAGVIHRDLKPANIFVVQREHAPPVVKVLDFGIAKLAADVVEDGELNTLTQTGIMIGTPRYMSPEQCDGAKLTPASDVYSLGIILYELLTGSTPFTGTSPLALALQHSSRPPRPPRELRPSIPAEIEAVALKALDKKPEERPSDANEFRRMLYAAAERAGLEHAAAYTAPTAQMLRAASTESPSGRLVLDIERMREQRAAQANIRETTLLAETSGTGGNSAAATTGRQPSVTASTPVAEPTNPNAASENAASVDAASDKATRSAAANPEGAASAAANSASTNPDAARSDAAGARSAHVAASPEAARVKQPHAFTRMRISTLRKQSVLQWLRQPPVLASVAVAILALIIGIASMVNGRTGDESAPLVNAQPTPAAATPTPDAPTPTPTRSEETREANRKQPPESRRRESRPSPPRAQPKKPSKIGSALKKIKKIFKSPF